MGVKGRHQAIGVPIVCSGHQHALRSGMDASIRPTGSLGHGGVFIQGLKRLPQFPLDAPQGGLNLPSIEARADVGQAQKEGKGHALIVGLEGFLETKILWNVVFALLWNNAASGRRIDIASAYFLGVRSQEYRIFSPVEVF